MSRNIFFAGAAAIFLLAAVPVSGQTAQLTSTSEDRQSVNLTVYNSNIALVRETRLINLPTGQVALRFSNVAAQIRPETVHLISLTAAASLRILDQNYQYDLLNPNKLLDKYVGREVTLVLSRLEKNKEGLTPVQATLLSNNNGQVWRINNQIVINPMIAETRFPDVPANLVATPTLLWELENVNPGTQTLEASYLTGGMSWRADYVLVVDDRDSSGDLQGWITLTNASGVGFENARLQLVAGNLNRVAADQEKRPSASAGSLAGATVGGFREEAFFEYHLYTLQRPASIREQETKQVSLLESVGLSVSKEFVIGGRRTYYSDFNNPGQPIQEDVGVYIQFRNSQEHKLGLPLPAGTIRLYKKDEQGGQQFIGEDQIPHTPKDEDVRLKVGDAFDLTAVRKQTGYKVLGAHAREYAYEIKIRNHKDEPVTVTVYEPIGGDWEMISSSHKAEKLAAFAARFRVPVEKDGEAILSFRVRVKS